MAELADALDLGSSGKPCRFDSCYPHQGTLTSCQSFFFFKLFSQRIHKFITLWEYDGQSELPNISSGGMYYVEKRKKQMAGVFNGRHAGRLRLWSAEEFDRK